MQDLEKSRERRKEIVDKYGTVPTSVWNVSYKDNKLIWDPRTKQAAVAYHDPTMSKEMQDAFSTSGRTVRGKGAGQSLLPYDFVQRVVKFYSEPGEIVLDPTMGDATVMTVVYQLNRHFIGYDISEENFKMNVELKQRLLGQAEQATLLNNEVEIDIYKQSSESMTQISDETADMVFFSPPYWDLEYYGEEPEQLGFGKSYEDFLAGLGRVINETHRVLKKDKFCCININDFRKNGKFYDYHADVINLMNAAGYKRHDSIIVVWPNCIGQAFASQVEDRKICAKAHEYLIIGRKV